jgi:hypothetical protein
MRKLGVTLSLAMLLSSCGGTGSETTLSDSGSATTEAGTEGAITTAVAAGTTQLTEAAGGEAPTTVAVSGGELVDACALLTAAEAGVLLGEPAAPTGPDEAVGGGSACTWEGPPQGELDIPRSIFIQVYPGPEYYPRPGFEDADTEDLTGLGEQAFVHEPSGTIAWVESGQTVMVSFGGADRDELVALAELMVAKP